MTLGKLLVTLKRIHMMYRGAPLVVEYMTPLGKARRVELDSNVQLERDPQGEPYCRVSGRVEMTRFPNNML